MKLTHKKISSQKSPWCLLNDQVKDDEDHKKDTEVLEFQRCKEKMLVVKIRKDY